jgi:KDO2-lipid IV(A) lauroyltransferase
VRRTTSKDRVEYFGAAVFVALARLLPLGAALGLARFLGTVAFDVLGYRRGVAIANLKGHLGAPASPWDQAGERPAWRAIGRESVAGFVAGLAEFGRLPMIDRGYMENHIELEGREYLDQALAEGKGAVLVTGHFGSWEVTGCALARLGYPIGFLVGVQRNRLIQTMMNSIRKACGIEVHEPHDLLRAVRSLRANRFVAMLSDQDAGRKGVFVEFLGEPASTPRGPARLALLAGSPIIPGFTIAVGRGRHRIVIERPIYPPERPGEDAVRDLTQAYTRVMEIYVRRYPASWLWTHRRWKTRPA